MKILFVNPRFPNSLWRFTGLEEIVGTHCGQTPLGLLTVAGLTPPEIEVELQDENVRVVDFETDATVVAIGCWNIQYSRTLQLAEEFRRRGKFVVVGGPYPTLCPERFTNGPFDVVFDGEIEITWPQFCNDLQTGSFRPVYKQDGNIDIRLSPVPRFDLIRQEDYLYNFVQTTRGCPFLCEFCDIIITDGRIPRVKRVTQVMQEIETIHKLGGRYITFSDANLIGNTKYAEELFKALVDFQEKNQFPVQFQAEMTLNVAELPQLLHLMQKAKFSSVFLGIESPRADSLNATKKKVNVHKPLIESIRKIQSHNLVITAGMIVGFDQDDTQIFQEQFDFLMEAGIPFTTCGVLSAIEKTPLHTRLEKEGRLLSYDSAYMQAHGSSDLNFIPKLMTAEEVHVGYNWLIRSLYNSENYSTRLVRALAQFTHAKPGTTSGKVDTRDLYTLFRTIKHYVLTVNATRRRFFLKTLWKVIQQGPSLEKLENALSYMVGFIHFHEYVTATQGDPESVSPVSPFVEAKSSVQLSQNDFNLDYVKSLKEKLYPHDGLAWVGRRMRRAVMVPEEFLNDRLGKCLHHYLTELGVEVVPVATAALSRLQHKADVFVLPILNKVLKGREELHQVLQHLQEHLQKELKTLPKVIHFPLDQGQVAEFEAFARLGLLFTRQIEQLAEAYRKAIETVLVASEPSNQSPELVQIS